MTLVVLLGGARSGKSQLALRLAERAAAPVVFVATGEGRDEEMTDRIERHRGERPPAWTTIEEPTELTQAILSVPAGSTAIVDCLSLWVSNVIESWTNEAIEEASVRAAGAAASRDGVTIVVSNEIGLGIVPMNPLGRRYRDVLGRVNTMWVEAAAESYLVVAGRRLRLEETL